ncbi:MAG: prepilin-type N-terminal cleavage/methylation domain-containing protein [Patescibacteria group bacterium]|jgi:prepilin-type N-terminal cleavage/methylation domain-containing protein
MVRNFKNSAGFTLIELIVSTAVLATIFGFVLANFRTGQRSGEIDIVTKQIINGVTTVRNMNLGGQQLVNGSFPDGGYGIDFDLAYPSRYVLFSAANAGDSYAPGNELVNGIKQFNGNIKITQLCGLTASEITGLPCDPAAGWQLIGNFLAVVFSLPNNITTHFANPGSYKYVGGTLEHQISGQKAYFYVSLISGLTAGDLYGKK